jgi:hypothetical protein
MAWWHPILRATGSGLVIVGGDHLLVEVGLGERPPDVERSMIGDRNSTMCPLQGFLSYL